MSNQIVPRISRRAVGSWIVAAALAVLTAAFVVQGLH